METAFPANHVIETFRHCESQLNEILRVVPYCKEHEKVWSPLFSSLLLDSCSQLDSLWRGLAWESECVRAKHKRDDLNMKNYFHFFNDHPKAPLCDRWVVFWGRDGSIVRPFSEWRASKTYKTLFWWKAYNKIKHDRLVNLKLATYEAAICALAGLFLSIIRASECHTAINSANWIYSDGLHWIP